MPNNDPSIKINARRQFLYNASLASAGIFLASRSGWANKASNFFKANPDSKFKGVQIGVITYSFRSMPGKPEQLVQYCVDSNISAIELMGDSVEDFAGKPVNTFKMPPRVNGQAPQLTDEQKSQVAAYQMQVAQWRAEAPMDKFKEVRKMFDNAGVTIYAFKPNALNATNTDAEIEYALRAAKALGATSVTVELPTDAAQSKRLGDLGAKNNMYIGYHAHLQATDASWDTALAQSPYNSMNLDCGHYIAAGGNNTKETLLALIEARHDRITSLHIKDRKSKDNGGKNVVWGEGDTPLKGILALLKEKKYKIPATIELEYDIPAGSDAVQETKKCVQYAKQILEG
jgi:sugar phosphate isomerase/epimerase